MAISRVTTWNAGDVLTAAALNGEFNNVINNALALVSPLTGNLDVSSQQLLNVRVEVLTATQSSTLANQGRVYYNPPEGSIHVDSGIVSGGTGQNPGPGGIGRVPVLQGLQGGDIPYASPFYTSTGAISGATGFARLGIGAAFSTLTPVGGLPVWRLVLPTVQTFLSGTAATYTTPANVAYIDVEMVGGGGGGGGGNSGGAGGNATASTWSGGSLSAGGGTGGASPGVGGAGGTATGGNIVSFNGAAGGDGAGLATNSAGGPGASSVFGGAGAPGSPGANAGGNAITNTGGGGAGGGIGAVNNAGGGGGAGGYVRHRIGSPAATYTYTVGAGGGAGAAGATAGNGGTGAAGAIIVTEHYV